MPIRPGALAKATRPATSLAPATSIGTTTSMIVHTSASPHIARNTTALAGWGWDSLLIFESPVRNGWAPPRSAATAQTRCAMAQKSWIPG